MAHANEYSREKLEAELRPLLDKMDSTQLGQFLTICSARNIVNFSDRFFGSSHQTVKHDIIRKNESG